GRRSGGIRVCHRPDRRRTFGGKRHPILPRAGWSVDQIRATHQPVLSGVRGRPGGLVGATPARRGCGGQRGAQPGASGIGAAGGHGVLKAVITQNVDDLHGQAGSRALLEIHGNRNYLRCVGCGGRWPRADYVIGDVPPICRACGGVIKLDTVMFGEPIPRATLDACFAEVRRCDTVLLVGTSGTVNPAAQFPLLARELGARVIEVNPGPTQLTHAANVAINGPAGELLPKIVESVRRRLQRIE
ncbi:NAD-dependent protein deacylase 2, partial [Geodia barretti]